MGPQLYLSSCQHRIIFSMCCPKLLLTSHGGWPERARSSGCNLDIGPVFEIRIFELLTEAEEVFAKRMSLFCFWRASLSCSRFCGSWWCWFQTMEVTFRRKKMMESTANTTRLTCDCHNLTCSRFQATKSSNVKRQIAKLRSDFCREDMLENPIWKRDVDLRLDESREKKRSSQGWEVQ